MVRAFARTVIAVTVLIAGLSAGGARADTLDDVLAVLSTAGVVDPVVVEAKPMIQCLVNGQSVEICAEEAAGKAHGFVPNDPKIKKVVDIFHAVQAKAWLDVFMLAGEQVVCSLIPTGGTIKDLFCGEIFDVAEPVIASAYKAVIDGDILGLVTTVGVGYACDLLPDAPGASELCGVLGEIVQGVADAVGGMVGTFGNLLEDIAGQSQHMPVEEYYLKYWRNWLHYAVVKNLHTGQPHYLHVGNYAMSSTSCQEYFDSHKMSASNAQKVCGIMKQRFLQEVDEVTKVWQAFPATFFAGWAAPNVRSWTVMYYSKLEEYAQVAGGHTGPHQSQHGKYLLKSDAPFKDLNAKCGAQLPLSMPAMPYEVHAVDKANMSTARGWACLQVGDLLAEALLAQKAILKAVLPKMTALGCTKASNAAAPYIYCQSYEKFKACRALYDGGESAEGNICQINQLAADPALAKAIAVKLGTKRCHATPHSTSYSNVECERPWKQAQCKSLLDSLSSGAFKKPTISCLLKHDRAFAAGKRDASEIVKNLSATSSGMGTVDPASGATSGLAIYTPGECSRSADDEWDPLRIHCKAEAAKKKLAAMLPTCDPDPQKDGADKPCYDGPLTLDAPVSQHAAASLPPQASPIIDVEIDYFDRSGSGWTAVDRPSVGNLVAVRCRYEHPPVPPQEPAVPWSIGFLEGGRVMAEMPGAAPITAENLAVRTWYGTLLASGPIELGCARVVGGEPDKAIRAVRAADVRGAARAPREQGEARIAAALPAQSRALRGAAPLMDLRFAQFTGVKRNARIGESQEAPLITTAAVGDAVLIDCSYVLRMDAPRDEAVRVSEWQGVIEIDGRAVRSFRGDQRHLGGSQETLSLYRFKPAEPGETAIRCRLDTENALAESDETNNELTLKLTVTAARRTLSGTGR